MSIPVYTSAADAAAANTPDHINAAVQRCREAYYHAAAEGTKSRELAQQAYRDAMPHLTSRAAIQDFIACVSYGMLLHVFWRTEGPRLLRAAHAALAAMPLQSSVPPSLTGRPRQY